MIDLTEKEYFPLVEQIVDALCVYTNNQDRSFFRNSVIFMCGIVASSMRTKVLFRDRGKPIPVNTYVVSLAGSGYNKGRSLKVLEGEIFNQFREIFLTQTFPTISSEEIDKLATNQALLKNTDFIEEKEALQADVNGAGNIKFFFDSGTPEGAKQQRRKMGICNVGALNFVGDELAKNIVKNQEMLSLFLELYDTGEVKDKLIMNSSDKKRGEDLFFRVPANMLLFGTPARLLDGSKTEDALFDLFDNGYVRRCLFSYAVKDVQPCKLTAAERFNKSTDPELANKMQTISNMLGFLADPLYYDKTIVASDEVCILLIEYQQHCEELASQVNKYEDLARTEIEHRYFNVLKLSGIFAFMIRSPKVTKEILFAAIAYVEDSGKAFNEILKREPIYVKLCNYLCNCNNAVTRVELLESLPIFKGTVTQQNDLITLATIYGYKNNSIIKKHFIDGIEFLKGESLKETNLDKLILACSTQLAENYNPVVKNTSWKDLYKLTQLDGYHWINHHMIDNYRNEKNAIPGFNMVVIDIDGDISLPTAQLLLREYTYLTYTTKRHIEDSHRFRLIFPISHELKLNAEDFTEFMQNIFAWLPFKVIDDKTGQRSKKWLSHKGSYHYNDGILLDALQFIPKTAKAEEQKKVILDTQSLTNIERWFHKQASEGNRSNSIIKYALMLVDSGLDEETIQAKVLEFNNKLSHKLEETEILVTIMRTVIKAISKRN
jgi:hypothetical protein